MRLDRDCLAAKSWTSDFVEPQVGEGETLIFLNIALWRPFQDNTVGAPLAPI